MLMIGCSSSDKVVSTIDEPASAPLVGAWADSESGETIYFLSTGKVTIETGIILDTINRFQNTQRSRYTSRLLNTGTYIVSENGELTLFLTADWTGKGTGARRPANKRVKSTITFEFVMTNDLTLTLRKKHMTQGSEENKNSDEELLFTLKHID